MLLTQGSVKIAVEASNEQEGSALQLAAASVAALTAQVVFFPELVG